jgi:hypothetical protein
MVTFLKNTNIAELLRVSSGDFSALDEMTEEFRKRIQESSAKPASADTSSTPVRPK